MLIESMNNSSVNLYNGDNNQGCQFSPKSKQNGGLFSNELLNMP